MYKNEKNGKNLSKKYIKTYLGGIEMKQNDMKNIIVLKELPSNLIEEAIVFLKENKKIHKYQLVDINEKKEKLEKEQDNQYIVKEAELLLQTYTEKLEKQSPKWKNNMRKLEKRYKNSLRLNIFFLFTTILGVIFSLL